MDFQERLSKLNKSIEGTREHIRVIERLGDFKLVEEWKHWLETQLDAKKQLEQEVESKLPISVKIENQILQIKDNKKSLESLYSLLKDFLENEGYIFEWGHNWRGVPTEFAVYSQVLDEWRENQKDYNKRRDTKYPDYAVINWSELTDPYFIEDEENVE